MAIGASPLDWSPVRSGPAHAPATSDCRLLLACFPKSGSTYLATLLAALPGFQKASLVPSYGRREQELSLESVRSACLTAGPFVAQHHVRYSEETRRIVELLALRPIVLVRNIFDVAVSIRDHLRSSNRIIAQAFVPPDLPQWSDERIEQFIADLILPWYFNFYASWSECPTRLEFTYERLRSDPFSVLHAIRDWSALEASDTDLRSAIERTNAEHELTRFNVGICGRGNTLSAEVVERIQCLASYYRFLDLSSLGLGSMGSSLD